MMMSKIFRTGSSMVVSLPTEMLESLQLTEGVEVSIELDAEHGCIVIAPSSIDVEGIDTVFVKQVADFIAQYRPALDALAK